MAAGSAWDSACCMVMNTFHWLFSGEASGERCSLLH